MKTDFMKLKHPVIWIAVLFISFLLACEKEEMPAGRNIQEPESPNISIKGKKWVLYSGRVYLENISAGGKRSSLDHFGAGRNASNTDIDESSSLPFDMIQQSQSTWEFTTDKKFILNGVLQYQYEFQPYRDNDVDGAYRVFGLENGSARPVVLLNSKTDYMNVRVCEFTASIGSEDFAFYSVLTFIREGFTGTPEEYREPASRWIYAGVLNTNAVPPAQTEMNGTRWVVTQYVQNFISQFPNDTLNFGTYQYTINGSAPRTYSVSYLAGSNMKQINLYSFTTLGGDYSGMVQNTYLQDSVINNALFVSLFNISMPETRIWMNRIQ